MFTLTSPAFKEGQQIPTKYANILYPGGKDISIPLAWTDAPAGTKSFALVCVDRSPAAGNWIHWAVINIPAKAASIAEGASKTEKMPSGAKELQNTFTNIGYNGPTPPPGTGTHEYEFTLYALKTDLIEVPEMPTLAAFEAAIKDETMGAAKLKGTLTRP